MTLIEFLKRSFLCSVNLSLSVSTRGLISKLFFVHACTLENNLKDYLNEEEPKLIECMCCVGS